jgi:hypothetical protein
VADSNEKKSTPLPWVILSGVLGLFAVGAPKTATNPVEPKPLEKKDTSADSPAPRFSGRNPLKPVYDFYATQDAGLNPEEGLRQQLHGYEAEFLIATVPDPIDSPFGSAFDHVVEAIQRAVERKDGYILDRTWLPWELDKRAKPKPGDDPLDVPTLRESQPGVLLFRHGTDKARNVDRPGLCVVFLVGETPIGGMHKKAFTSCLRILAETGHPVEKPVRVVGPFFSGSQTSLMFAVKDWWEGARRDWLSWAIANPPYRFEVLTGNATAVRKPDFFNLKPKLGNSSEPKPMASLSSSVGGVVAQVSHQLTAPQLGPRPRGEDKTPGLLPTVPFSAPGVDFASTTVPTRLTVKALLHYLAERDGTSAADPITGDSNQLPGKVAILTEANTSMGKQVAAMQGDQLVMLRFPLHISRVKSESNQAFKREDEQAGLKQGDPLVHGLFDDGSCPSEGIPSQGGAATAAANGQVLESILSTIAREKCRYVGVIATDTKDKLFLIRLVREFCPDVHVFVTGADVLLAHPDYRYHMRGVLIGSTYPLFPPNQRWVKPSSGERNLFPSAAAQGYYNAALLQLGLPQHLLEYTPPPFALVGAAADDPARQRPPIWISMVSPSGALVPLQVFTRYDDSVGYVKTVPGAGRERTPDGTLQTDGPRPPSLEYPGALLPLAAGLFLFWSYLVYRAWLRPSPQFFWPVVRLDAGDTSLSNLFYRNLILGAQAVLVVPVLVLTISHARSHQWEFGDILFTSLAGAVELLLLGALFRPLLGRKQQRALQRRALPTEYSLDRWVWRFLNAVLIGAVLAFVALYLGRFWLKSDIPHRVFFFVRAVDLGTGLSPLTPLFFMCLTFTAWGYFQLKRIYLADRYSIPTPYPEPRTDHPDEHRWFDRVRKLDAGLNREIAHVRFLSRHGSVIVVMAVGLGLLGAGVWTQSLPTVEGSVWDGLFFAGFWVLFTLTVMTLLHLFLLWGQTKKLLGSMGLIPAMRALTHFPAKVSAVFGKYLYTQRPHLSHLQVPAHQLRLLATEVEADAEAPVELKGLSSIADDVEQKLRDNLMAGQGSIRPFRAARDLRTTFSGVAERCLQALSPRWKTLSVDEAFGGDAAEDHRDKPAASPEPKWVALAEGLVATQAVIYVSQFFVQLRNLVTAVMACSTLLLLAATSYPFHPERLLLLCLLGLMGGGVVAVVYVLVEMNRDEVVSRMSRTTPGRLSLDGGLIGSFLTYVVPALGILAAQLSGSFRWLAEPILRVMK